MSRIHIGDHLYIELQRIAENNGMLTSEISREVLTAFVRANRLKERSEARSVPISHGERMAKIQQQLQASANKPYMASFVRQ